MRLNIDELMHAVNCMKFPDRWREIYNDAMDDFYKNGCELTNPDYYDKLGDTYNILTKHRDVCKKAAEEIGKNEYLSAFLALLCYALKDRAACETELSDFSQPISPDGEHLLSYDMITALAAFSYIPFCYDTLKAKNIPQDIIDDLLQDFERYIDQYMARNNGAYGFSLISWCQLVINGKMILIDRLYFELYSSFKGNAVVFENKCGKQIALAQNAALHNSGYALGARNFEDESGSWYAYITETDIGWCGYPYDDNGYVRKEPISLSKSEWKIILSPGDPVVGLHIPHGRGLKSEAIDETLNRAKEFLKAYYPDFNYKAFTCYSWLLDPQLHELLDKDSNILKFGKRFNVISAKSAGNDIFYFVFLKPLGSEVVLNELAENTSLTKALKSHYTSGKVIYEMHGYFFS